MFNKSVILFLLVATTFNGAVDGTVALSNFIPFGVSNGDQAEGRNDDGSTPQLNLTTEFQFFGSSHTSAWVNTNGAISFASIISTFTPSCTPVQAAYQMVSPFWADVDTTYYANGTIFYRQSTAQAVLSQAQEEITRVFPSSTIKPISWAFVATWYDVTFYGAEIDARNVTVDGPVPTNTMQAVLATNGEHSFAIFYYNKVTWTAGTASGGDAIHGRGGSPARAGFDAGDGQHLYLIKGSCEESIVNLPSESNVNKPGVFVFQIDKNDVITPSNPPTVPSTEAMTTTNPPTTVPTTAVPTTVVLTTAVPTTAVPTTPVLPACSGHGSCVCDKGYDGSDCGHAINFCAEPVGIVGYANYSEACQPHGHCVSVTPTGAHCVCDQGWYGPFCEDHDSTKLVTERCYYSQPTSGQLPNVPVGCNHTSKGEPQACIPDDLNCFIPDPKCANPIGWCLPRSVSLNKFIQELSRNCPNFKIPMPMDTMKSPAKNP